MRLGATIYVADEAGIRSDYHAGTTWAPVGQTPVSRGLWCATRRCLSEWRCESFIAGPS